MSPGKPLKRRDSAAGQGVARRLASLRRVANEEFSPEGSPPVTVRRTPAGATRLEWGDRQRAVLGRDDFLQLDQAVLPHVIGQAGALGAVLSPYFTERRPDGTLAINRLELRRPGVIELNSLGLNLSLNLFKASLSARGFLLPSVARGLIGMPFVDQIELTPTPRHSIHRGRSHSLLYLGEGRWGWARPEEGLIQAQLKTSEVVFQILGFYPTSEGHWVRKAGPLGSSGPGRRAELTLQRMAAMVEIGKELAEEDRRAPGRETAAPAQLIVVPTQRGFELLAQFGVGATARAMMEWDPESATPGPLTARTSIGDFDQDPRPEQRLDDWHRRIRNQLSGSLDRWRTIHWDELQFPALR